MKKKHIISLYNNGRLANQLWTAASLYAYCLEKGYKYSNYTFFPYQKYYNHTTGFWLVDKLLTRLPLRVAKAIFLFFAFLVKKFKSKQIIDDHCQEFLLSPSEIVDNYSQERLDYVDNSSWSRFYFWGWVFRNPVGLKKYFSEIKEFFAPTSFYLNQVNVCLNDCRCKGKIVIGVHIRQGDFKRWQNGTYYFSFEDVRVIIDKFLQSRESSSDYVFLLCSDSKIDETIFKGINYVIGPGNAVADLYSLAKCEAIFGAGGTYGPWAAYYGGVSFIRFSRKEMVWPENL